MQLTNRVINLQTALYNLEQKCQNMTLVKKTFFSMRVSRFF